MVKFYNEWSPHSFKFRITNLVHIEQNLITLHRKIEQLLEVLPGKFHINEPLRDLRSVLLGILLAHLAESLHAPIGCLWEGALHFCPGHSAKAGLSWMGLGDCTNLKAFQHLIWDFPTNYSSKEERNYLDSCKETRHLFSFGRVMFMYQANRRILSLPFGYYSLVAPQIPHLLASSCVNTSDTMI